MSVIIKLLLIIVLIAICYQDFKERQVYLVLLILSGISMGFLYLSSSDPIIFFWNIAMNISVIFIIYSILFFYSLWRFKKHLSQMFGSGDLLFFIILAIGFSTATFLVLFSLSLIFSLAIYKTIKSNLTIKTVPLAGLQALFISLIYTFNWIFQITNLYAL
jgi:hypothetical protein